MKRVRFDRASFLATLFDPKRRVPCYYKVKGKYCGKPSAPVSNYCKQHGQAMRRYIEKGERLS